MLSSQPPSRLTKSNSIGGDRKNKEPKFVPYEPYKAAVNPMVADIRSKKMKKKKSSSSSSTAQKQQKEEFSSEFVVTSQPAAVFASSSSVVESRGSQTLSAEAVEKIRKQSRQELEAKDVEVATLKKDLAEKEKQLRIQTQVNTEVKRLLVASVGEDVEAKVDFLTQDKARLAADIRQYATKISRDFEEMEHLSVESNLWKSKFLACRWGWKLVGHTHVCFGG
jgi:hypothetical protein